MVDRIAYKVLRAAEWEEFERDGVFRGSPVDRADGFIHLSSGPQVTETVDKHFSGLTDLVLVVVDLARVGDAVRWEPSRGGAFFPHIHGVLPREAVVSAGPLERTGHGLVKLPG
jgi:uncharacterized protein (DUF952 family)